MNENLGPILLIVGGILVAAAILPRLAQLPPVEPPPIEPPPIEPPPVPTGQPKVAQLEVRYAPLLF